jgi:hypothetical protein
VCIRLQIQAVVHSIHAFSFPSCLLHLHRRWVRVRRGLALRCTDFTLLNHTRLVRDLANGLEDDKKKSAIMEES